MKRGSLMLSHTSVPCLGAHGLFFDLKIFNVGVK